MNAVAEALPTTTKTAKATALKPTGDVIVDTAARIAEMSKTKVLNRIETLMANEGETDFELGGLFLQLNNQNWIEGSTSFDEYVRDTIGVHPRKARYLMGIYKELVDKMIPWEIVKDVGWTKLREIAAKGVLTPDNAQEWADKAKKLSVVELIKVLRGMVAGDGSPSPSTKDDVQTMKFKLKNDQVETVNSALAKAKSEGNTEFDNTALEYICQAYLSGSATAAPKLEDLMASAGPEPVLKLFDKIFKGWTVSVDPPEDYVPEETEDTGEEG